MDKKYRITDCILSNAYTCLREHQHAAVFKTGIFMRLELACGELGRGHVTMLLFKPASKFAFEMQSS